MSGYREDLAYIHDAGFGEFARRAAPGILRILRDSGIRRGLVVDLGSGSGIWAAELLRAGYDVLGVDISPHMIRLARKRAPQACFVRASLLDVRLPPCDAVTSLGEPINYCFDPRNSEQKLVGLFRRVFERLRPGGVFLFDVVEPGRLPKHVRRWAAGEDWAMLSETAEDRRRRILARTIITFRRVGKFYRRSQEEHRLRLYPRTEILAHLRRTGFRVRALRAYGSYRLLPARLALVARKPVASSAAVR